MGEVLALLGHVGVGPAEHLNDAALLTVFVHSVLIDLIVLPGEVQWLEIDGEVVGVGVSGFHLKGKSFGLVSTNMDLVGVSELRVTPFVLNRGDAGVSAAAGRHGGTRAVSVILDLVVAHDAAEALILFLVLVGAGKVSLEGAVGPLCGVGGHVARRAAEVVKVGAVGGAGACCSDGNTCECLHSFCI